MDCLSNTKFEDVMDVEVGSGCVTGNRSDVWLRARECVRVEVMEIDRMYS